MKKINFKNILSFWIGFSIIALSFSIIKFSNTLLKVNNNIPEILNQIEAINQRIDTISTRTIPDIINLTPKILSQIDSVQTKIPPILLRVDSITKQIPNITNTIDNATETTNQTLIRIDSINKKIPEIFNLVNITNDSISNYLNQTKVIITNADNIAKDAGRNATKGVIGGIVSIPIDVVKGAGNFVLGKYSKLTKKEIIEVEKVVVEFLNKNSTKNKLKWNSEKIKKSGTIEILKKYQRQGKFIKKIKLTLNENNESIIVHFYQKKDKSWFFLK